MKDNGRRSLMKYLLIIVSITMLSCNLFNAGPSNKKITDTVHNSMPFKSDTSNLIDEVAVNDGSKMINIDSIVEMKLPFGKINIGLKEFALKSDTIFDYGVQGDKMSGIFKYYQLIGTVSGDRDAFEISAKENEYINRLYNPVHIYLEDIAAGKNGFNKVEEADFRFNYICRLPNLGKNKILLFKVKSDKRFLDNTEVLDWVIMNNRNEVLNSLNVSSSLSETGNNAELKYGYIDTNYIITIRYFSIGEGFYIQTACVKYKVLESGKIARRYDIENGHYKTNIEEGEVMNHVRQGSWREIYGKGLEDEETFNQSYKDGIVQK